MWCEGFTGGTDSGAGGLGVYGSFGVRRPFVTISIALVTAVVVVGLVGLPWFIGRDRGSKSGDPYVYVPPQVARPQIPHSTTPPPMRRLTVPASGAYFGVFAPELVRGQSAVRTWSAGHGVRPRVVSWFQQWLSGEKRFRTDWVDAVADAGAVPMITWEPWRKQDSLGAKQRWVQPDIAPRVIASGRYDAYVRAWARAAAAHRGPILIRLMHEMNGFWYPWAAHDNGNTPAEYVAAWRHVVGIFRAEGARNVGFVWSINNLEGADGRTERIRDYYPGDAYVDWVGTSGFNWGDSYDWSSWRSATQIFHHTYYRLAAFGKPVIFTEVGTVQGGGDAKAWVRDALVTFRGYARLGAVVWYDHVDAEGNDFRLRTGQLGSLRGGQRWYRQLETAPVARENRVPRAAGGASPATGARVVTAAAG